MSNNRFPPFLNSGSNMTDMWLALLGATCFNKPTKEQIKKKQELQEWEFQVGCMLENFPCYKGELGRLHELVSYLANMHESASVRLWEKKLEKEGLLNKLKEISGE